MTRRIKGAPMPSEGEAMLALQLRAEQCAFIPQYKPIPDRKFAFDFYVAPDLLIEVNGGAWSKGKMGHNSGTGLQRDAEKISLAAVQGFRMIVATTEQVKKGHAIQWIMAARKHGLKQLVLKRHEA